MGHIFISHAEKDAALAQELAKGLEAAGYSTWYFERDILPGTSYMTQTAQAIEQSQAIVLLVSSNALDSDEVTKEVAGASGSRKPFFPILVDLSSAQLKERQPGWHHAFGDTAMLCLSTEGHQNCIARITDGLKAMGISPEVGGIGLKVPKRMAPTSASYTPKHLADKILAARASLEGERKQVTVLFADVKGFTSISEKLDPEDVNDLISECLVFITEEIHRYEGTIAQFLGDGLLALFGAPIAHEDAPQRALYAALGMRDHLREYALKLKKQRGIEFNMRIGLNTGLVVVGKIGDDLTMEYTAMGDTVNLASRMESTAESGTIQVSENTYRLTEGYFEFKPLGEIELKGKVEPVKAYQLLGPGRIKTRLGVSEMRGLTPFVGRRTELDHLLRCYEQAKRGQGQVVGITGEPGVGKSRLLLQLRSMLHQAEYSCLEGECHYYGDTVAYFPILDILRSYYGIEEGEQEALSRKKLQQRISQLDQRLMGILPPLQDLMSLKVEDEQYLRLDPKVKRARIFDAIWSLLVRESQSRPLVLVVEDLQWIDKTSEEFLDYIIARLGGTRIMLIILYRPEYSHPWGSKTYYSQIRVDELPLEASAQMVQAMLKEGKAAQDLVRLILDRAAGNPLFMEEFTRSLLERSYIERKDGHYVLTVKPSDIQVPDTVQGIIAGRMDRLEESLKQTMQVASVIGRDFSFRILQAVTGVKEELRSYLFSLQELEFIYEKSLFPELEYIFKHALTQDVAYNSLLLKRRRDIHERTGKAIEQLYSDRLEEFYEVLAHHYSRSEDLEKAYQYLKLSGDKAFHNYAVRETVGFYRQAINVLRKLPDTKENKRRGIEVRLLMHSPLSKLGYPEGSLEILQEGQRMSEELCDEKSLATFYSRLGLYHSVQGDHHQGISFAEDALKEAKKTGDIALIAPIAFDLCVSYCLAGEVRKAVDVAPTVIALLEKERRESDSFGRGLNPYSVLLSTCGAAMALTGDFGQGQALCEKGLRFALSIDDLYSACFAETFYSLLFSFRGDGKSTVEHSQTAIRYSEETEFAVAAGAAWHFLGVGYYYQGEMEKALKNIEKGIEIHRGIGLRGLLPVMYWFQSMARLDAGDLKSARSSVEESLRLAREHNLKHWEGMSMVSLGKILAKSDPPQSLESEQSILHGIRILDDSKLKPVSYIGHLYRGELYADVGQKERALETLKIAESAFREMGMDYWLRRTQEDMAKLQG